MGKKRIKAKRRNVARRRARPRRESAESPQGLTLPTGAGQVDIAPLSSAVRAVARGFAVIALRLAEGRLTSTGMKRAANVGPRARFLQALGLEPGEIGAILGSTERSVAELLWRARKGRSRGRRRG